MRLSFGSYDTKKGGDQDNDHAQGYDKPDHIDIQLFGAENAVFFHLVDDGLGTNGIADQNRRQQCDDGHGDIITDKVKEIQDLIAKNRHMREHAVAQRGGQGEQEGGDKNGQADRFLPR